MGYSADVRRKRGGDESMAMLAMFGSELPALESSAVSTSSTLRAAKKLRMSARSRARASIAWRDAVGRQSSGSLIIRIFQSLDVQMNAHGSYLQGFGLQIVHRQWMRSHPVLG